MFFSVEKFSLKFVSIVIDCVRHYDIIDRVSSSLFIGLCVFVSPVRKSNRKFAACGKSP